MAVDDVAFYNLLGEEITRSYLVEQMINYYGLKLDAGETRVTDFNEGSEIRNLLESIAVDVYTLMEEQNELTATGFIDSAEGEFLDRHGENPFINLPRDTGMEASGSVTFSVDSVMTSETVIPEGTIVVNSSTGLEYTTLYDAVLDTESTSVVVAVECLTTGEDGNCGIGEIDTIEEEISDIPTLSVTNEQTITGGTDYEEDEEYRERLLSYVRQDDFGSMAYYTRLGLTVDGVHDIALVDDENEVFTKIVLVNGNVKPTPATILAEVLEEYTNINNIVLNHRFSVDKPDYVPVDLDISLNVTEEVSEDKINTLLEDIFNGGDTLLGFEYDGLYIGNDLASDMLTSNLILLEGVVEATITMEVDGVTVDPVTVEENEVCELGEVNITQTVVN